MISSADQKLQDITQQSEKGRPLISIIPVQLTQNQKTNIPNTHQQNHQQQTSLTCAKQCKDQVGGNYKIKFFFRTGTRLLAICQGSPWKEENEDHENAWGAHNSTENKKCCENDTGICAFWFHVTSSCAVSHSVDVFNVSKSTLAAKHFNRHLSQHSSISGKAATE